MTEFFQTRMGNRFYESTMPRIADELKRLNDLLERVVKLVEAGRRNNTESEEANGEN